MNIKVEISKPHYHPGPDWKLPLTKKRDLSVPPYWVANERREFGPQSLAIVMPPRDKELYEFDQPVHIHIPEFLEIEVNGKKMKAKIKVEKGYDFEPTVHFDHLEAEKLEIKSGDIAVL